MFSGTNCINNKYHSLQRICISKDQSIELNLQTKNQNDHIWRYERQLRVTASDCYALFTGFNNQADMSKRIVSYYQPKPQIKNFQIGRREEANAFLAYQRIFQNPVSKLGFLVHPSCPWFGCSPDGYCIECNIVIEIKILINEKNEDFKDALRKTAYLKYNNETFQLKEKHKYYAQVQVNMLLLKSKTCHLVIYNYKTDEIEIVIVKFDEEFANNLLSVLCNVYFHHMLPYIFEKFVTEKDKLKYQ